MTEPWDMTPAQRMQFREAHADAKRRQMAKDETGDVIDGTVTPEDLVRANLRAAGFPIASAAEARAAQAEAEQWVQDFIAASRAEDGIVIDHPREA